jgi:SAM-dependent methyltransferase/tetratricopeptide (TPR) repeat protein
MTDRDAHDLLLQDGMDLLRKGFWEPGREQVRRSARLLRTRYPDLKPGPWLTLGQGLPEQAAREFEALAARYPRWWEPRLRLAESLLAADRLERVLELFERAAALGAPREPVVLGRIQALLAADRVDEAAEAVEGAAGVLPEWQLASLRDAVARLREALAGAARGLRFRQIVWLLLSRYSFWEYHYVLKRRRRAEIMVRRRPRSVFFWRLNLAVHEQHPDLRWLDFREERRAARRLIELRPRAAEGRLALARSFMKSRSFPAAEAVCREALAAGLRSPRLHWMLGNALCGQGRLDEAVAAYERARRGPSPTPAELRVNLAAAELLRGRSEQARNALGRLPRRSSAHPLALALECILDAPEQAPELYARRARERRVDHDHLRAFGPLDRFLIRRRLRQIEATPGLGDVPPAEWIPCPVCGATGPESFKLIYANMLSHFEVRRCGKCELVMTNPMPAQERLSRFYSEGYFDFDLDRAKWFTSRRERFLVDVNYYADRFEWLEQQGLQQLEARAGGGRRALDIGCSTGLMLQELARRGWRCAGLDISPRAVDYVREQGFEGFQGNLETVDLPRERYHLLHLAHVIEHVRRPERLLELARDATAPGGWILLITPCAGTPPAAFAGAEWFNDPTHVFFFHRRALTELVRRAGLEILAVHAPVGVQFETFAGRWRRSMIGPAVERILTRHDLGDVIWILARKPR